MNGEVTADFHLCAALLPRVSRTFALSILALPRALRRPVQTAYLMCRLLDTVEDDPKLTGAVRSALFDAFDALLNDDRLEADGFVRQCAQVGLGANAEEGLLCASAAQVWGCFRALPSRQRSAIRPHVLEMSFGMRSFSVRAGSNGELQLRDVAELERYCYFVAGTVGALLTALFAARSVDGRGVDRTTQARAIRFGIGLQLVNILKDVAEDGARGVCYLPCELAEQHGVNLDTLFEPSQRQRGLSLVRALAARAREHLAQAEPYVLAWPADNAHEIRFFCAVPLLLAQATLREIESGRRVLERDVAPKVGRLEVARLVAEARIAARSDDALRTLIQRDATAVV